MNLIKNLEQLIESKEQQLARIKNDYKNAMNWVRLPADKVSDRERAKWQRLADTLKRHAKNQFKIDLDEGVKESKLVEGRIAGFIPPFSVRGNWVDDSRGRGICEMGESRPALNEIAAALNAWTSSNESVNLTESTTADMLDEGDKVEITGDVEHHGEKGTIERFGTDKKFVVVKFSDGSNASFHSSDVSLAEDDETDDEEEEQEDPDTFYVAFYDEDEERSWIGEVTKEGGGKWHEKSYKGEADYRWGQSYMSYLSPHDVMNWIHKDYRRGMDIEGPFFDADEAEQYVLHNYGGLEKQTNESIDAAGNTYYDMCYKDAKENKPSKLKELSGNDKMNYKMGYTDGITDRKKIASEAFKLNDRVKIIGGPKDVRNKEGVIGEIRKDVGGKKSYTIDYELNGKTTSVMLQASDLRALKESSLMRELTTIREGAVKDALEDAISATIERMPLALMREPYEEIVQQIAAKVHEKNPNADLDLIIDMVKTQFEPEDVKESASDDEWPKLVSKADEFRVEMDKDEQVHLLDGEGTVRVSMPLVIWKQLCR